MFRKSLVGGLLAGMAVISVTASAGGMDQLKAYPQAAKGMTRYVIDLPNKDRNVEGNYGVELIVGRTMKTDGTNLVHLTGEIKTQTINGWGYNYYEVTGDPKPVSTLMAPIAGRQRDEFVSLPSLKVAYNSRLPVVVYVPVGYEVHYRLWSADKTTSSAVKQ